MMINRRLIGVVPDSMRYIGGNVALQWLSLLANIALTTALACFLRDLCLGTAGQGELMRTVLVAVAAAAVRFVCSLGSAG